jgi:hypothetical protein
MQDAMMTVMAAWIAFNALLAMMLGLSLLAKRSTSGRRPGRIRDDAQLRDDGDAPHGALYERTAR